MGLEHLQKGSISLDDETIADAETGLDTPPEQRGIGMMFQDYALFPHLTVMENICFGLRQQGSEGNKNRGREGLGTQYAGALWPHPACRWLSQHLVGRRAATGGFVARACPQSPSVLLLDEPFSALDAARRIEMREETAKLIKEAGASAIMVTHDSEEAMFMADRIKIMNQGRIVQSGKPDEIYMKPKSAFIASLFGHANQFCETVKDGHVTTPLGRFKANGLPEGSKACVFIRPEGVMPLEKSEAGDDGPTAEVVSSHYLGIASHIHLRRPGLDNGSKITFHAQCPGRYLPRIGSRTAYRVDPTLVFVFAEDKS